MGAYVSVPDCQAHYNVTLNCTLGTFDNATHKFESLGGITRGNFESDGDIAGIGVQGVFIGVTSFALALSIFDLVWQASKTLKWKRTLSKEERMKNPKKRSASDIMETLVQACSDQQIFTGAAYALALRYWRGCTISAYHYNLVANMMLLTCATHLMSVTIIRNYWKYPWLAVLRVLCVSGVFVVTGVLMSNQNVPDNPNFVFPTSVPPRNETDSLMFLPAACFQNASASLTDIFRDSTSSSTQFFVNAIGNSTPRNKIQGWRWYLIMLFFYGAAMIAEFIRFCRRNQTRQGWRANLAASVKRLIGTGGKRRTIIKYLFLLYLVAGIGISTTTVIFTASYIMSLRQWVDQSRWVALKNGQNPENDATSFGQLVPIFLSALVLFSFLQTLSGTLSPLARKGSSC
ncbi:hypothetical protein BJ170DRAFT_588031 [Xylariales sp. AK1849]|nr:hypothetical protein BJ170DRAFT_588031 [Xylariales sp. AK1849]